MFGRYKTKAEDFSKDSLPKTRKQQLKSFFKNEKMTIFKISLLLFLFALPFILTLGYQSLVLFSFQDSVAKGEMTQTDASYLFAMEDLIFNAIKFASILIFGIGLAGTLRIIRNLCWNEGVFFFDDFKKGVKQNYKQIVFPCIVIGIALFLVSTFKDFYNLTGSPILLIGYVLSIAVIFFIIVPVILFLISQITFYEGKLYILLSNAFNLAFSKFLIIMLFSTFIGVVCGLYFILSPMLYFLIITASLLLFSGIFLVILHLYSLSVFDVLINKENEKYYRKGLY